VDYLHNRIDARLRADSLKDVTSCALARLGDDEFLVAECLGGGQAVEHRVSTISTHLHDYASLLSKPL